MNKIDAQIEQLIEARNSKGLSLEDELELTRLQILSNSNNPERDFPTSLIKTHPQQHMRRVEECV